MNKKIKGSLSRGVNRVRSFFSGNNRRSRQNTGPPLSSPAGSLPRAALDLYASGKINKVGGSKRKRKRKRNRTARKPKKRSKRTRRQNVNRQKR